MDVVIDEATAGTSNGEQWLLSTDCGRSAGYRGFRGCGRLECPGCKQLPCIGLGCEAYSRVFVGGASVHELP